MKSSKVTYTFILLIGITIFSVFLCGCTGTQKQAGTNQPISSNASGSTEGTEEQVLTISGSTTVLPIAAQVAEKYMDANPELDIQVNGGGTGVGVQSAGEGTAMIGMASRDLKTEEKEKYPDLIQKEIAIDGIAIITHKDNPILSMTLGQVRSVYDGNITNWKDLGGKDAKIVVVGRDSASGTRDFFHEKVMENTDFVQTQLEKNSNGAVKQTIEQTPGAIGYVGLGYLDDTINAVPIKTESKIVVPSIETVKDKSYPIARPLIMLTKGEPTGLASKFFIFLASPEGAAIITEEGCVPIGE